MPFPLLLGAIPPLIAWGTRAAATYGLARLFSEEPIQELSNMLTGLVVEQAAVRAGLQLDPDDPFSDASMANAVGLRVGIPLRSLKDRQIIMEDVDTWAAALLTEKIGYQISSLRDPAAARADLEAAALNIITARTGIPFAVGRGMSPEEIRAAVEDWARARLAVEMAGSATAAKNILGGVGVDFEALAAEMNGKLVALGSENAVNAGQLALHVAESMVKTSVEKLQVRASGMTKKSRRSLQVRAAQQRFRSLHGNRQIYVPLGMVGTVG